MESLKTLDYIEGGLNKKVIYSTENGAMIELAFDAGKGLDTHSAPGDVVVQVVEGTVDFTVGDTVNRMEQGDYIRMAKDEAHSVKAVTKAKILVTKFL